MKQKDKMYVCMRLQMKPQVQIGSAWAQDVILPEGGIGILFVFKTKKALRAFHGDKAEMITVEKVQ